MKDVLLRQIFPSIISTLICGIITSSTSYITKSLLDPKIMAVIITSMICTFIVILVNRCYFTRLRPLGNTGLKVDYTNRPICPHCEKNGIRSYLRREDEHKRYYCMTCNNSQFDSHEALREFYAKEQELNKSDSPLGKGWEV